MILSERYKKFIWLALLAMLVGVSLFCFQAYLSPEALINFANLRLC